MELRLANRIGTEVAPCGTVLQWGLPVPQYIPLDGRYPVVDLIGPTGIVTTHRVYDLVANAFLPKKPAYAHTRHLNGDKCDSRLVNLSWGTPLENGMDWDVDGFAIIHGFGLTVANEPYPWESIGKYRARLKSIKESMTQA